MRVHYAKFSLDGYLLGCQEYDDVELARKQFETDLDYLDYMLANIIPLEPDVYYVNEGDSEYVLMLTEGSERHA